MNCSTKPIFDYFSRVNNCSIHIHGYIRFATNQYAYLEIQKIRQKHNMDVPVQVRLKSCSYSHPLPLKFSKNLNTQLKFTQKEAGK